MKGGKEGRSAGGVKLLGCIGWLAAWRGVVEKSGKIERSAGGVKVLGCSGWLVCFMVWWGEGE